MNNEFRIVKNMKQFILSLDSFLSYRKVHEKRVFLKLILDERMYLQYNTIIRGDYDYENTQGISISFVSNKRTRSNYS